MVHLHGSGDAQQIIRFMKMFLFIIAIVAMLICNLTQWVLVTFGDGVQNKGVQNKIYDKGSYVFTKYEDFEEQWSWGFVDDAVPQKETIKKQISTTTTSSPIVGSSGNIEEGDPCKRKAPVKPDFNVPGRTINVAKCYEYIWQLNYREVTNKNKRDCREYAKKHPELGYVFIAAIGGRDALPGEFPHMGAIGWQARVGTWVFKCGGTLISENFVLTAAHCSKATDRDTDIADLVPKIVRFGDKNIIDTYANGLYPTDGDISKITQHPQYKAPRKYYDIALIEIKYKLDFNYNVQPACLWNSFDVSKLGSQAAVTGWGIFQSGGRDTSPVLQAATVDFIDSPTCDSLLRPRCNRHWCGINDTQICAGKLAGGVDACQGDSGGPLSVRIPLPVSAEGAMHHVVGVTSFGFGCALKDTPGVYTRVSSFVPWIESIVWPS